MDTKVVFPPDLVSLVSMVVHVLKSTQFFLVSTHSAIAGSEL